MRNGFYRLEGSTERAAQATFRNPENILQGLSNYQIDLILDIVDAEDDSSASGIRFEGDDSAGEYFFGITDNRSYIGSWDDLEIFRLIDDESYVNVLSGNNVLTVRKVYNKFYLYLNQNKLFEFDDFDYDGLTIRVRAGTNSRVDFEDLRVQKIL